MAVILAGPHKGRTFHTKVSNFTETKWRSVNVTHGYDVSFNDSTYEQRKTAAHDYLERCCKTVMLTDTTP